MLPFEEEQLRRAAESILQYTEVLAATYDGQRTSDILVASVWYCLKEEQKKVQRLEEALKIQNSDGQRNGSDGKQVVSPDKKAVNSLKPESAKKTAPSVAASNIRKTPNEAVYHFGTKNNKTETNYSKETKNKPKTVHKEGRNNDSDVCVIEIDDDDDEIEKKNGKNSSTTVDKRDLKVTNQKVSNTSKPNALTPTKNNSLTQKQANPVKTIPAPTKSQNDASKQANNGKLKEINKNIIEETIILDDDDEVVEQETSCSSDHEMFDMDCEEIQDETMRKISISKTPDKILKPSEKAKAFSISEDTDSDKIREDSQKSPRTRSQSKSDKEKRENEEKSGKDKNKSEDQIEELNVIFENSDEETELSESVKEHKVKTISQSAKNEKTDDDTESNKQTPFPITLTQNIARQAEVIVAESDINSINPVSSNNTQHYTTVVPQDQNVHVPSAEINCQFATLTQSVENSNVVSVSGLVNNEFSILDVGGMNNTMDNRSQFLQQSISNPVALSDIKTEDSGIDVDAAQGIAPSQIEGMMAPQGIVSHQDIPGVPQHLAAGHSMVPHSMVPPQSLDQQQAAAVQGIHALQSLQGMVAPVAAVQGMISQPPMGYMLNPNIQSSSGYVDLQFNRQQFLPPNNNPVSLSSLSSGALTYPYSSTDSASALYGSSQQGMITAGEPDYMNSVYQQQQGLQQFPEPDLTDQGRKRGKPGESISPPAKKRLLDFDRKWHEGPSNSKGQEKYIAPPSNALKTAQSSWNEGQATITEMEWALRFNTYQSVSNHVPPPFVGADIEQNIVQTEVVGVSLDDVGIHGHEEENAVNDSVEKGSLRGRGRRGRGSWRGRGAVSKAGVTSRVGQQKGLDNIRGKGRGSKSPGSPHKSGTFSFFKRGRLGFSQKTSSKTPGKQSLTQSGATGVSRGSKRGRPSGGNRGARRRGVKTRSQT